MIVPTNLEPKIYNSCGNIIGVFPLNGQTHSRESFLKNSGLRAKIQKWGLDHRVDSVMILFYEPRLWKTLVFEPNCDSELSGGISTMCGNGIRAIGAYLKIQEGEKIEIETAAGTIEVKGLGAHQYRAYMGILHNLNSRPNRYLNIADIQNSLTHIILRNTGKQIKALAAGFTSSIQTDEADGEPHLMLDFSGSVSTLRELKNIAYLTGKDIVHNQKIFPHGINVNFCFFDGHTAYNVTYERNLGPGPETSVTQACGTGATFVGAKFLDSLNRNFIEIHNIGGVLSVEKRSSQLFLTGLSKEIKQTI